MWTDIILQPQLENLARSYKLICHWDFLEPWSAYFRSVLNTYVSEIWREVTQWRCGSGGWDTVKVVKFRTVQHCARLAHDAPVTMRDWFVYFPFDMEEDTKEWGYDFRSKTLVDWPEWRKHNGNYDSVEQYPSHRLNFSPPAFVTSPSSFSPQVYHHSRLPSTLVINRLFFDRVFDLSSRNRQILPSCLR
jgi:hypothetical protein